MQMPRPLRPADAPARGDDFDALFRQHGAVVARWAAALGGPPVMSEADLEDLRDKKAAFLTASYARFQWVATFVCWGVPAFKVLFDATDIPQGDAVSGVYIENQLAA